MRTRLPLVPAIAAILLIPTFLVLGYWQLQRAEEKRVLQMEYDRRAAEPPVRLGAEPQVVEALQFRHVIATGRYRPEHQLLLDNRVHRGVAGYHVLTPLEVGATDTFVLVNRGWVAAGPDRAQLPTIDTPRGNVTVTGVAAAPHEGGFRLGAADPLRAPIWQQLDMTRYAERVGAPLQPVVILLDPRSDAGGFVREWNRLDAGIAVHQGYAFQWFALAAATLVLYGVLARRAYKTGRSRPAL